MKSKTVCFFRPSPISTNFTGLHQSEWLLQAPHTIDNNTQILNARMLFPAVRPII